MAHLATASDAMQEGNDNGGVDFDWCCAVRAHHLSGLSRPPRRPPRRTTAFARNGLELTSSHGKRKRSPPRAEWSRGETNTGMGASGPSAFVGRAADFRQRAQIV